MRDPNFSNTLADELASRLQFEDQQPYYVHSRISTLITMDMPSHAPSTTSVGRFKRLGPSATLLLFTPVTTPFGYSAPGKADAKHVQAASTPKARINTDPFEMLGRAFSKFHRRIRHVPYVPRVGFTETHDLFLREADAVIVVTYMPEEPADTGASSPCSTASVSITNQARFTEHAADALEDVERIVPMLNLHFGDDDDEQWDAGVATYKHIWIGDRYDEDAVKNAVELVFGSRT